MDMPQIKSIVGYVLVALSIAMHLISGSNEKQFKSRVLLALLGIALMH